MSGIIKKRLLGATFYAIFCVRT